MVHQMLEGVGADVVLTNPDREKLRYALRFEFKASKMMHNTKL